MDSQNIKVYLAISGALIVLLILIIVIPFTKQKPVTNLQQPINNLIPTTVETNQSPDTNTPTPATRKAGFAGALDEPVPQNIIDLSNQKRDLQSKVPLNLSTFSIDFDYGEDKFIVSLKDPRDTAQKEFESWRGANYPALGSEQFTFR